MKTFIAILIIILTEGISANEKYLLNCCGCILDSSRAVMMRQAGTLETTNRNDGDVVKYLHTVGLGEGNPYCAAGQYYCFAEAALLCSCGIPVKRTGSANEMFNDARERGKAAKYKAEIDGLLVWRKPRSWAGHIERIFATGKAGWVRTIGFNTMDLRTGKQGVFMKRRNIYHPLGRLQIRGIIAFRRIECLHS